MLLDAIQLGPFTIHYMYIVSASSFLCAYFLLQWLVSDSLKQYIKKYFFEGIIFYIVAFKGSILFFNPHLILQNPFAFFMFNGTRLNAYVALCITYVILLLYIKQKESISIQTYTFTFGSISIVYLILYYSVSAIWFT